MKAIKIVLVFITLTCQLSAQTDSKEQLIVPLSEPGKAFSLDVNLVNGSIKVVTYDGKDIIIDAQTNSKNDDENNSQTNSKGMKRINSGVNFELTAEEKNNHIHINSDSYKRPIHLSLKIPQNANLKLGTVNNGNIFVDGVNGKLEVNNVNGGISLTNISGSAVATTVNGTVLVTFKSVEPNAPLAFTTLNGDVDVTFPAGVKANVKLKSEMGEVYSDFDIDINKSQPKAIKTNNSGLYKISVEDWIIGKINGGGPEMLMKNMHGSIMIRKAK